PHPDGDGFGFALPRCFGPGRAFASADRCRPPHPIGVPGQGVSMSVKVGENGLRSVQVEVEVPGTPEEVWQAIASGPGISSWFVPSELEQRDGGKAVSHFSPDGSMDSVGKITAWSPPHRFVVE